jgi:hypothetical protein
MFEVKNSTVLKSRSKVKLPCYMKNDFAHDFNFNEINGSFIAIKSFCDFFYFFAAKSTY